MKEFYSRRISAMNSNPEAVKAAFAACGGPAQAAAVMSCSVQAAYLYQKGDRAFPPGYAAQIEQAAGGAVRRWDMFPTTWHLIWPELIGVEGAPAVPATEGGA